MRTRRGVSLIELLVTMSACTVVLTLTGVLLQRAMRVQIESRAAASAERTALRLATQFRRDVHEAKSVTANASAGGGEVFLRLGLDGGRNVEYSRRENVVQRVESGGDKPTWREDFAFPSVSEMTIKQEESPRRLAITITAPRTEPLATDAKPLLRPIAIPMYFHVEPIVGQNHRFNDVPGAVEGPR